jgi:hypothetical protein
MLPYCFLDVAASDVDAAAFSPKFVDLDLIGALFNVLG